jgi:hypothetical protein
MRRLIALDAKWVKRFRGAARQASGAGHEGSIA